MDRINEPLLSAREVAEMLNVSIWSVQIWARTGKILTLRLPGGNLRFRREDVEKMLQREE